MFNVLEERDIQVRGYSLRLPLDLLLVASANPEDYTNRGRIITPLKDRFGAEIRTHYPIEVDRGGRGHRPGGRARRRRARAPARGAGPARPRAARVVVGRPAGRRVSARFAIAAAEGVAASALRRAARTGEEPPVARVCDVPAVLPTLLGKLEFEMGEEGREVEVVAATCCGSRSPRRSASGSAGLDLSGFTELFAEGAIVETGELVAAEELLGQLGAVPGLAKVLDRLGARRRRVGRGTSPPRVELVLEGLHLTRRIDKENVGRPDGLRRLT